MSGSLIPKPFAFHGDHLSTCKNEETGTVYCIPREIADNLGLAWPSQHAKLTKSLLYKESTLRNDIVTQGQNHQTVLLDVDMLPAWLMSISAEKVNPTIREKLLHYQRECAKALRDYWVEGAAVNPRHSLDRFPELRAIVELAQSTAEARLAAEEAKADAAEAKQDAAKANALALQAIDTQQFLTIAEYVYCHDLGAQMPPSLCQEFGLYLSDYCQKHGIPTRKIPVAYKRWEYEYGYHVGSIALLLPGWVKRRYSQIHLLPGGA